MPIHVPSVSRQNRMRLCGEKYGGHVQNQSKFNFLVNETEPCAAAKKTPFLLAKNLPQVEIFYSTTLRFVFYIQEDFELV